MQPQQPTPVTTPDNTAQPTPTPAPVQAPQPVLARPVVSMNDITPKNPLPPASVAPARPPHTPLPSLPTQAVMPPSTPSSEVSFQPGLAATQRPGVERIDEKPQQSSKDIESLIKREHRFKRLKGILSVLVFIAGVVGAVIVINQFIFQSYYVDGTSMTPTLQHNDRLIIDKVEKTWAHLQGQPYVPSRGQIVVLDSSIIGIGGREEQLIKRVVGIPGDTVIVKNGAVTIKNKDNPEGFDYDKQLGLDLAPTYVSNPIEITIPEGQVYVMGDNRAENGSYDSRAFGPIESSKLVGRLWARILPIDKAQIY